MVRGTYRLVVDEVDAGEGEKVKMDDEGKFCGLVISQRWS